MKTTYPTVDTGVRPLVVNYSASRMDVIASGNYDSDNTHFTVNAFPDTEKGSGQVEFEVRYVQSESHMPTDRGFVLISGLDVADPWQAAGMEHLLAFGIKYRSEISQSPIIALNARGMFQGEVHLVGLINLAESPYREGNLMMLASIRRPSYYLAPCPWRRSVWQPDTRLLVVRRVRK